MPNALVGSQQQVSHKVLKHTTLYTSTFTSSRPRSSSPIWDSSPQVDLICTTPSVPGVHLPVQYAISTGSQKQYVGPVRHAPSTTSTGTVKALEAWCKSMDLPDAVLSRLQEEQFQHPQHLVHLNRSELARIVHGLKLGVQASFHHSVHLLRTSVEPHEDAPSFHQTATLEDAAQHGMGRLFGLDETVAPARARAKHVRTETISTNNDYNNDYDDIEALMTRNLSVQTLREENVHGALGGAPPAIARTLDEDAREAHDRQPAWAVAEDAEVDRRHIGLSLGVSSGPERREFAADTQWCDESPA